MKNKYETGHQWILRLPPHTPLLFMAFSGLKITSFVLYFFPFARNRLRLVIVWLNFYLFQIFLWLFLAIFFSLQHGKAVKARKLFAFVSVSVCFLFVGWGKPLSGFFWALECFYDMGFGKPRRRREEVVVKWNRKESWML